MWWINLLIIYFSINVGTSLGFMVRQTLKKDKDPYNSAIAILALFVGCPVLIYVLITKK